MGYIFRVVDSCDLGAVSASIEALEPTHNNMYRACLRLRPHAPATYLPAQGNSILLTPATVKLLVELLERQGLWPVPAGE